MQGAFVGLTWAELDLRWLEAHSRQIISLVTNVPISARVSLFAHVLCTLPEDFEDTILYQTIPGILQLVIPTPHIFLSCNATNQANLIVIYHDTYYLPTLS